MQGASELRGFHTDRPTLIALLLADSVAIGPNNKPSFQGVFDHVTALGYPVSVNAAIIAGFAGVLEPIDLRIETVGYPKDQPLGVRQLVGTARIEVPPAGLGTVAGAFVSGIVLFPVTEPGMAEVRVYGNGELLGMRPVMIIGGQIPGASG